MAYDRRTILKGRPDRVVLAALEKAAAEQGKHGRFVAREIAIVRGMGRRTFEDMVAADLIETTSHDGVNEADRLYTLTPKGLQTLAHGRAVP